LQNKPPLLDRSDDINNVNQHGTPANNDTSGNQEQWHYQDFMSHISQLSMTEIEKLSATLQQTLRAASSSQTIDVVSGKQTHDASSPTTPSSIQDYTRMLWNQLVTLDVCLFFVCFVLFCYSSFLTMKRIQSNH
jgi:hypothetical protein